MQQHAAVLFPPQKKKKEKKSEPGDISCDIERSKLAANDAFAIFPKAKYK